MDITCSLVGDAADAQCNGWRGLGGSLKRSAAADGGLSLWFERTVEEVIRELVAREADCCPFLDLTVVPEGASVRLDVTSSQPEARPVIDALGELVGAVDR